jgi:hypothetical protein
VVLEVDVARWVKTTVTPGILDPDASDTVPTIPPVVSWAIAIGGWQAINTAQTTRLTTKHVRFVIVFPLGKRDAPAVPNQKRVAPISAYHIAPLLAQCQELFAVQIALIQGIRKFDNG